MAGGRFEKKMMKMMMRKDESRKSKSTTQRVAAVKTWADFLRGKKKKKVFISKS